MVSYAQSSYSVGEGSSVPITVTLSADPERTVTIPISVTLNGGASSADYSGVPDSLTFNSSDTEKSFTFSATQDTEDDDGESVKLAFGALPTAVSAGAKCKAMVNITDDDLPIEPSPTPTYTPTASSAARDVLDPVPTRTNTPFPTTPSHTPIAINTVTPAPPPATAMPTSTTTKAERGPTPHPSVVPTSAHMPPMAAPSTSTPKPPPPGRCIVLHPPRLVEILASLMRKSDGTTDTNTWSLDVTRNAAPGESMSQPHQRSPSKRPAVADVVAREFRRWGLYGDLN